MIVVGWWKMIGKLIVGVGLLFAISIVGIVVVLLFGVVIVTFIYGPFQLPPYYWLLLYPMPYTPIVVIVVLLLCNLRYWFVVIGIINYY